MNHFINLYLTIVFQYLESTLHTLVVAKSDIPQTFGQAFRLSVTFVKVVCIKCVDPSIVSNHALPICICLARLVDEYSSTLTAMAIAIGHGSV